ncbi:MAG: insulinase family protein [Clostridia bacterium]|nr:insulinase family protein [Clostridia bacterium]
MELLQQMPCKGVIYNYGFADHFKTGYLSVDFFMPLTKENATGMSLLAGMLCRGCKKYPGMDLISRYLAKNYGASLSVTASKAGELEILTFAFSFLDREYTIDGEDVRRAMIALFRELVFAPLAENGAFRSDYMEQEKSNLIDKITGIFNDKRVYALEQCKSLMCENEAFGIGEYGDIELVKAYNEKSLYDYFRKLLDEAWVMVNYVGKERELFMDALTEGLSPRTTEMPSTQVVEFSGKVREIVDPLDLNQSKLTLGFRLGKAALEKPMACRLFNVLYGGSATSKLFMNVRERLSLCYYCSSRLDRLKNVMFVASGIEAEKYEQARNEIEHQLKNVAQGEFTQEEMDNAKAYLIDSFRSFYDNESALASMMITGTLHGKVCLPEEEIQAVQAVTREDLVAVAREVQLDTVYFLKGVHHEGE